MYLDHEKLDVYKVAIEFTVLIDIFIKSFPKGNAYLADQLLRAARRSATECSAILDICLNLHLIEKHTQTQARNLLIRIVSMLPKMVKIIFTTPLLQHHRNYRQ